MLEKTCEGIGGANENAACGSNIQANESKPQFKNAYEAQLGNFSSSPPHPSKQRFLFILPPFFSCTHAGSVMAVQQFCIQNHEPLLRPLLTQCFLLACTDQLIYYFFLHLLCSGHPRALSGSRCCTESSCQSETDGQKIREKGSKTRG